MMGMLTLPMVFFVYTGDSVIPEDLEGEVVCVSGQVKEYYSQTQIDLGNESGASTYQIIEGGNNSVDVTPLDLDVNQSLEPQLEKYEGMLVSTSGSNLVVTRNFGFDYDSYRNNMVLSLGKPLVKPTQLEAALSDEAVSLAKANSQGHLFVDTDDKPSDGVIPYFDGFNPEDGYILVGDTVQNLEGVLGYKYSEYRLVPKTGLKMDASDFEHNIADRTSEPDMVKGQNLRVASFNVLNFFNSGIDYDGDGEADGAKNPANQNRGAGSNEADFTKQKTKIVEALFAMDADIVGLMEIENNGFGEMSAIQDLVNGLNDKFVNEGDHYAFVRSPGGGFIGSDAITVWYALSSVPRCAGWIFENYRDAHSAVRVSCIGKGEG